MRRARRWSVLPSLALSSLLVTTACSSGDPKPMESTGVSIGSQAARSCELLLKDHALLVQNVVFGAQVKGTMQRWAPKSGIAFVALADTPMTGTVATVQSTGTPTEGSSAFDLVTVTCFDREGKPVASPDLHFQ